MEKELIQRDEIKRVGLTTRTNNHNEMNPATGKIGSMMGEFFSHQWASKMAHRKNPGVTLCVYTEYDSDEHGDYMYFIGEVRSYPRRHENACYTRVSLSKVHNTCGKNA